MDDPHARQNFDIFCSAIDVELRVLVANHETHTDIVTFVGKESIKQDVFDTKAYVDADGMVTNSKGICLFLYASDCAMLFFLDPKKEALGACHAGWVGSVNGIIDKTVSMMRQEYGSDPQYILVAISPTIGPCCYYVDASRYEKIFAYDPKLDGFIEKKDGVYFLDLPAINNMWLCKQVFWKKILRCHGTVHLVVLICSIHIAGTREKMVLTVLLLVCCLNGSIL
jgi:YfiH family protein